jgi:hypothetical protein
MKRGFLKTFEIFFLEKTFKIWVGVIHVQGQYTSKYGICCAFTCHPDENNWELIKVYYSSVSTTKLIYC